MPDLFDVRAAADVVLRGDRLTEVPVGDPDAPIGLFDGQDRDLLVQGDLACVLVVKGHRGMLVEGSIRGTAAQPIRVEVKGDVVVTGSVVHAEIHGRNVLVGGSASHLQLTAAEHVTVVGPFADGRVLTGDYEEDRHRIESCRISLEQTRRQAESLDRRVATDEKRLDKSCCALRIPLDFNVGRIVQHKKGRVEVDLSSFYSSMEGRSEEQIELALAEFFAKGVMGVITRQNRKYLVNYPAREKVFLQLVRGLRELFEAVLERDRLRQRVGLLDGRLGQMVESLSQRQGAVAIAGAVAGDTEMEFILPRVVRRSKDQEGCDFGHQTARLEIHTDSGGAAVVVSFGADGERTSTTVPATELEGSRFAVADGRVLWEPVADTIGV